MPSTSAEGRSSCRSDNVFGVVTGPRGSIVAYRYDKAPATGTGAWSGSHSSVAKTRSGLIERRSHDNVRHGTSTLFAALDIATGQVTAALKPRHRNQEFLAFLKQIERAYRHEVDADGNPVELHLVMDNYAAHKHANIKKWLADNPRFTVHFTPSHASWMNLVEVWFGIVERQAIRRGVFTSVKDLNAKIRAFIDGWNKRSHPFVWTKTAEEVLAKANRKKTSNADH